MTKMLTCLGFQLVARNCLNARNTCTSAYYKLQQIQYDVKIMSYFEQNELPLINTVALSVHHIKHFPKQWSIPKLKPLCNLGCLETRWDLECWIPVFSKLERCTNAKDKAHATDYVSILPFLCESFAECMFVECWTGAFQDQVQFRFRNI